MTIKEFKEQLACVFDDNLHTKQWHNYVDYAIIGLIILSTLQIFLSTYEGIELNFGNILKWIDYITIILFTIEVTLRIWCADIIDEKYKGFWGRVKYCFTFYGLIDFISTYSFYVALFFPIPYNVLKVLRVARLLRIFRYMKAFTILHRAISSKKNELIVSLQFLVIITLMLSFILFFVEHEAQPEVYSNGWTSVLWAFAQYIGDPGNFADTPPITVTGRLIACIIGILGIAIFAVPAGLIASGFTDSMDEMKREEELATYRKIIWKQFNRITPSGIADYIKSLPDEENAWYKGVKFSSVVDNVPVSNLALWGIDLKDVLETCKIYPEFRVVNEAKAIPVGENGRTDRFMIEHFPVNRKYGYFINRGSKITIVSTQSTSIGNGNFSYYLAKYAGFNYMSKDFNTSNYSPENFLTNRWGESWHEGRTLKSRIDAGERVSKELIEEYRDKKALKDEFVADLESLCREDGSWVIALDSFVKGDKDTHDIYMTHTLKDGSHDTIFNEYSYRCMLDALETDLMKRYNVTIGENLKESYLYPQNPNDFGKPDSFRTIFYKLHEDGCKCSCFRMSVSKYLILFDSNHRAIDFALAKNIKDSFSPESKLLSAALEDLNRSDCWGYAEREQKVNEVKQDINKYL